MSDELPTTPEEDLLPEPTEELPEPPRALPTSDLDRARRFVEWLDGNLKYIFSWKQVARWQDNEWVLDPSGKDGNELMQQAGEFADYLMDEALQFPDGPQRTQAVAAANSARTSDHLSALIKIAKSHPDVAACPTDFDSDPWAIGVKNGIVNLKTGQWREAEKEDMILKKCPVEYDTQAKCPMWEEFLEQVQPNPEVRAFLKRAVGYALTGRTNEQILFFFYGVGQNGKSTFFTLMEHLLGDYSWRSPATLFLEAAGSENKSNMFAALPERRFVVGAEMPQKAVLAANTIKDLTGGDTINARKLYCEAFNFKPTHKLFFYGNWKPMVPDSDYGIWRRMCMVKFNTLIPPEKRDRGIDDRLWQEAAGVLNWAIEGCLEWQKEGLNPPEVIVNDTAEYREDEDLARRFVEEECSISEGLSVGYNRLSYCFELWLKEQGYKFTMSPRGFHDRIGRIEGIARGKSNGKRIWKGIAINDEAAYRTR